MRIFSDIKNISFEWNVRTDVKNLNTLLTEAFERYWYLRSDLVR